MKKCGSLKWLVAVGAVLLVVPLGAAACDSSDNDQASARQVMAAANSAQADNGTVGRPGSGMLAQRRQAMKERREARADRQEALLETVRDKMSAADQALFDQLTASVKDQRAAAQQARQKLADTLKQLRTLVDKYLESDDPGND